MSQNLKIQVIMSAIDKLTAPFRSAANQAQKMSTALRANKTLLKQLNQAQEKVKNTGLPQAQERLRAKIEQTNQAIKKQENALKKLNQQAKAKQRYNAQVQSLKNGSQFASSFGQRAMMHGGAVLGTGSFAMRNALTFEQEFSRVQALTRLDKVKDAESLKRLRDQAIHLGATTSFTTKEVASGQGYLAMAGFNPKQIEDSMPAILNMTKAAGMEMGRVSDIASDISSGFKIPAEQMNRVADVLTLTFTSSNTNLELLGETMKYLGPIASSTGQEFETMAAMVGLLGNVGIKGSQAGTSLRAAMTRLAGPPKMAKKAMAELGVKAKDAKGNMRAVTDILLDVFKKTEKMGSGTRLEYFKKIFGVEAATAMTELVNQMGVGGIEEFVKNLRNATGTAEKVASTMADNVLGDLKNLESAAEAVSISIFDETSDSMRGLIQQATELTRKINDWIKQNPKLTASITKWVAGIGAGLVSMGLLSITFSYLLYPVGRLALGLAKIGVIFPKLADGVSLFAKRVQTLKGGNALISIAKGLLSWKTVGTSVVSFFKFLGLGIVKLLNPLTYLKGALGLVTGAFRGFILISRLFITTPIGLILTAIGATAYLVYKNWEKVKRFFGGFWQGLKDGLAPVIEKFKPLGDLFSIVVGWIEKAVKWFTDLLSPVKNTNTELLAASKAGRQFGEWLAAGIDLVTKPLQWLMDSIQWVIDNMPSLSDIGKNLMPEAHSQQIQKTAALAGADPTGGELNLYDIPQVNRWSGGYAGNGGKYEPKGIYHGGEYIMTKAATARLGVPLLNALNYGKNALLAAGLGINIVNAAPVLHNDTPLFNAVPQNSITESLINIPHVNKWSGGYAGNGGKYEPKGIFHGGEYIMTKAATARLGVPLLNALNYGKNALLATGLGVSIATAQPFIIDNRPPLNATVHQSQSAPAQPMNVTININATNGQSAVDIAREVEKVLARIEQQKQVRSRSSLRDRD
ncbi:phage tail tape measure protein [Caviibacterium pharyngocola]|uniref:Phage tail tape measure protein n=1 Tax=Caviibacterium pharyngocola TaxID=28159 RepID=A0A2M8RTD1_9PAST|nr:phage tail tape measure protein [Caviibacterium pharyngocola]PJG82124.1 phage tail tape measure protein [Caviibacterium pharyngocola]